MQIPALAWLLVASAGGAIRSYPFRNGVGGYHAYRIPSLIACSNGDLLLFCEGRKLSSADHDWNDILTSRSTDGGRSWGPAVLVHSESTPERHVTIGNPSPVALTSNPGTVLLFFCRDNIDVAVASSTDDGKSWSAPRYFIQGNSSQFRAMLRVAPGKNISHIATGPPTSLQLATGRVVVPTAFCYDGGPATCRLESGDLDDWFAATLYTDDLGATWSVSNKAERGNECQVSPTQNGSLLLNQRTNYRERQLSWSNDDGATWSEPVASGAWPAGAGSCCCSTVFVPSGASDTSAGAPAAPAASGTMVFSGPDSAARANMTLFTSTDSGASWQWLEQVDPAAGRGAYSSLAAVNSTHVGLVYEADGALRFVLARLSAVGRGGGPAIN